MKTQDESSCDDTTQPVPARTGRSTLRRLTAVLVLLSVGVLGVWFVFSDEGGERTILVDGVERHYRLHVPASWADGLVPLVIAFHGFSGTGAGMEEKSRLNELADEHGFYVVYPDGDPSWHLFVPVSQEISPDVALFDRLREELTETLPIDPERIYVVGMSRGGDFAMYLAERRSEQIAAVVSQGACVDEVPNATRFFPVMFIVGMEDDRVPPRRFPAIPDAFRERGYVVEVRRPEKVGHRWHVPLNEELWQFLSSWSLDARGGERSE